MSKAHKLPSGSWRVQICMGTDAAGKKIRMSFTAPTKEEAELQARQFKAENQDLGIRAITAAEAIERYITAKTPVLSPPTIRAYRSYQKNHYAGIGKKKIITLTSEDMQLFISNLALEASPKTVANSYGLLASSVRLFCPDKVFNVSLPRRNTKRRISPSDGAVRALFQNADSELRKCIAISAFGSLRRGEICALRFRDISGNIVSVHADMVMDEAGEWIYKDIPKTSESNRAVRLPQEVIELLGFGAPDDYVISISPSRVSDRFIKLRKRLGLDGIRFHDLRHYYASIGAVLGIPDTYLSQFGGWKPNSPVMKTVYQNVIKDEAERYAKRMTKHFAKILV